MKPDTALPVLIERWPRCFFAHPRNRRPLKIGIADDILAAGVLTNDELSLTLRVYTGHIRYLETCVAGVSRIGLDGEPAGEEVSPAAAAHARVRAEAARKRWAADKSQAKATPPQAEVVPTEVLARVAPRAPITSTASGRRPVLTLPSLRKRA